MNEMKSAIYNINRRRVQANIKIRGIEDGSFEIPEAEENKEKRNESKEAYKMFGTS